MNKQTIEDVLRNVPLFKELINTELKEIVNIAITRTYQKGTHIFMHEDPLDYVYFIHTGKVKIYKNDIQGKEQIVSVLSEGDMFPHVGFFRKGNYPASSFAVESTAVVAISISHFEQLLLQHPEVCIKLFRVMGEKIIDLQKRLEEQILNNTYEQIVKLLLRLSETHGTEIDSHTRVLSTQFTNKELANMIGTTRETISRTITKLKKKGSITVNCDGNLVIDVNKFESEIL
ncbi:Crp/Fnr family transcriptional regulator [Cytobacillus sp. IB215665]|uniref:Crp/Fnr family transcriptional regulator n=1 Tax=Cytobacillus sp. IB215665 TaxID=3097357 RepID=UPI002A0FF20F|nr:Crp/Fnr family transcriptional regulator [Cytobacillus sp. IB215665]MDX8366493.1 Crp/Fnr family transcriptional regulator [Cytobacillus sp. IB215665]